MRKIDHIALGTASIDRLGNPYHGLVDGDGNLDTGVADPGILTGLKAGPDGYVLAVPGTPSGVVTDPAKGEAWRDTALIGSQADRLFVSTAYGISARRFIYGKELSVPACAWLYADSAGNRWMLSLRSPTNNTEGYSNLVMFDGHFAPRLYCQQFGDLGADAVGLLQLPTPTQVTFPNTGDGIQYPHAYGGPLAAYGDFVPTAPFYQASVLDSRAGGSKALIALHWTDLERGGNFRRIRALVEATVSGTGDPTGSTPGDGITVEFTLVAGIPDLESNTRSWNVHYTDTMNDEQTYIGSNPIVDLAGVIQSLIDLTCVTNATRLVSAWYHTDGTVKKRFAKYTGSQSRVYVTTAFGNSIERTDTESIDYTVDAVAQSTLSTSSSYSLFASFTVPPGYANRPVTLDEQITFADYWTVGDPDAMAWSWINPFGGSAYWAKTAENFDHHGRWKTHLEGQMFDGYMQDGWPVVIYKDVEETATPLAVYLSGWGPLGRTFLFGHDNRTWGSGTDARNLHIRMEKYHSDLMDGWRVDRFKQDLTNPSFPYDIAQGWFLQDLCTPLGATEDASRITSTEQALNLGLASLSSWRSLICEAAYDRYTGDTAWGTAQGQVLGYV